MHLFKEHGVRDYERAIAAIPVIDFGPWFQGDAGALERLAGELRHACEGVGFFYLKGHGVPEALIAEAFAASKRFHAQPLEAKLRLRLNENNIGYLPMNQSMQAASTVHKATKPNQNESFFVSYDRGSDHPDVIAGKPLRGRNQWPDESDLPGFRATVMGYFSALEGLAARMLPAFAAALALPPDWFAPYFAGEAHANLRLLHYPPQQDVGENEFGTAPHTDNSFMTILARNEVPGLAVRLTSGEWVSPPLIDGTFLVNLGNIMRRWSNDRFLSTPHGVINEGAADRYSLAFFYSPNPDSVIQVLPTCAGPDDPPRYPPAVYRDLVLAFYRANYFHQPGHRRPDAAE